MRYQGGKTKIAKEILSVILPYRQNRMFIEPFAGAFNITCLVDGSKWANDADKRLIDLFQALLNGWVPPDAVSKELYYDVKNNPLNHHPAMQAFVGCGCSFGGKWWGGWLGIDKTGRNYAKEAKNALLKKIKKIKDVKLTSLCYTQLELPKPSECIIYCDPPYNNTQGFDNKEFDSNKFWNWCENLKSNGYDVFVSEYSCPIHWNELWQKSVKMSLGGSWNIQQKIEKLFH